MSIVPLPIFERDEDPAFRDCGDVAAGRVVPATLVVKYGRMGAIGEFAYDGTVRPGCGTRLVVKTPRGTELAELLTVACGNGGCGKNLKREDLRSYIDASGSEGYPFSEEGRVERIATPEDMEHWSRVQDKASAALRPVREVAQRLGMPLKVIEVELLFGGEVATVWTTVIGPPVGSVATPLAEGASAGAAAEGDGGLDLEPLAVAIAHHFPGARMEMRSVGPRDEARLVANYEKCGQHCCCKNFLKVLKPVSMRHARHQKPTLDPMKISGRCGRLMCCLRYEEQTYTELAKKLPKRGARVVTPEGPGVVRDGKVLVQLVLVRLEGSGKEIAVPVEDLTE